MIDIRIHFKREHVAYQKDQTDKARFSFSLFPVLLLLLDFRSVLVDAEQNPNASRGHASRTSRNRK